MSIWKLDNRKWITVLAGTLAIVASFPAAADANNDQTQFAVTAGALGFSAAPALPTLTGVTLNGQAQTTDTTMTNFTVQDATGSGSGWNVTVSGNSGALKSPVFKQYCPTVGACGIDPGLTYVTGGATLPANSLVLNSTSASFTATNGTTGTAPTHQCNSGCNVDSASAVKVVSAAASAGMGTYATTGFTSSSLALATPTTMKALSNGEVYHVDVVWTLTSGP